MSPMDQQTPPAGASERRAAIIGNVNQKPGKCGPFVMAADTLEGNKVVDPAGDELGEGAGDADEEGPRKG